VEAARGQGLPAWRILLGHILPNCLPPLLVIAALQVARAITLARATVRNIRQNTGIALLTVAGLLAGVFAGEVHMAGGMFIHQASVLLVILNGMRLMRPRGGNKAPRATAGADMAASRA